MARPCCVGPNTAARPSLSPSGRGVHRRYAAEQLVGEVVEDVVAGAILVDGPDGGDRGEHDDERCEVAQLRRADDRRRHEEHSEGGDKDRHLLASLVEFPEACERWRIERQAEERDGSEREQRERDARGRGARRVLATGEDAGERRDDKPQKQKAVGLRINRKGDRQLDCVDGHEPHDTQEDGEQPGKGAARARPVARSGHRLDRT